MADPITTHAINVSGALNVLQAAHEFDVKCVVLASSCTVYGDNDDLPLPESSSPKSSKFDDALSSTQKSTSLKS
jgi:UDP-N-acetylglucosamine 4-epimerase